MTKIAKREASALTKVHILDAAEKLFADKGFDGTGIMELAKEAGVPKSLIYYYFENKEEILKELINRLVQEALDFKKDQFPVEDADKLLTKEGITRMMELSYPFFESRKRMYKIIQQEALKKEFIGDFLMKIQISQQASIDYFKKAGMEVDQNLLKFGHFFLILMPFLSFVVYREKWSEYNNTDPDILHDKFFDLLSDVTTLVINKSVTKN